MNSTAIRLKGDHLLLLGALWLSGCAGPGWIVEPLLYRNQGGMSPATKAGMFLSTAEFGIANEVAGRTPAAGIPTWEAWWTNRYQTARKYNAPEVADFYIRYIKTRRQQMGLPLYESGSFAPLPTSRKEANFHFVTSVIWPISTEKKGQPPPAYADNWADYWKYRYALLDRYLDTELAADHRKIIHKERRKERRHLYDPAVN